ncbi:lipoprotein [Streptomyces avidinii]
MNDLPKGAAAAFRRRYGASPLHLLLTLACLALALYAGIRLLKGDTMGVAIWFVGAALLHDLVLLPAYSLTDRAAQLLFRGRITAPGSVPRTSVNHIRVPAFVSGVLFLVWWPLILRQGGHYTAYTALSADGFLARWLLITAALFVASAIVWLVRTWLRLGPGRKETRAQGRARKPAK